MKEIHISTTGGCVVLDRKYEVEMHCGDGSVSRLSLDALVYEDFDRQCLRELEATGQTGIRFKD